MKKIVGVMPLWDDDKESIWMLPGYMEGIKDAGAIPIIFPFLENETEIIQLCEMCDGFLFTGGQDVSTDVYGQEVMTDLIDACRSRDVLEKIVLEYAISHDKAVLGICRGIQFINAALGGTLYQDIPTFHPSNVIHHMEAPYDRASHDVVLGRSSGLYKILEKDVLGVNSCHHQAIWKLAPELKEMAVAPDGIVEAVSMKNKKFIWAVQWHPEFSREVDEDSRKIFAAFVENC